MLEKAAYSTDVNVQTFTQIIDAWSKLYQKGGMESLLRELAKPLSNNAHGYRNLLEEDLANLIGIAEFFKNDAVNTKEDLGTMLQQLERIITSVNNMRGMMRQLGKPSVLDVHEILTVACDLTHDSLRRHHITLDVTCDPGLQIYMDRYELIEVINDLMRIGIDSIKKHSKPHAGNLTIRAKRQEDRVQIRIQDNGYGISDADLPYLFEPRLSIQGSSASHPGFALSIARRLIRGCEGDIAVEWTRVGQGTTFLVELPSLS
jgi:signal transduction histidine kinase